MAFTRGSPRSTPVVAVVASDRLVVGHSRPVLVEGRRQLEAATTRLLTALAGTLGEPMPPGGATPLGPRRWPRGVKGSLAHDDAVIVAVASRARVFAAIGIDIEPKEELPADVVDLVATSAERERNGDDLVTLRHVFCAKEAVFKALWPRDGRFLEFDDVEVDLRAGRAWTRYGAALTLTTRRCPRLLALATMGGGRLAERLAARAIDRLAHSLAFTMPTYS
jgi:4'-phosphopantetheinyl transferase EntD